jgi:Tol biopolymer transport system component
LMQLTNLPGNESDPVWSPDGKWISFIASEECGLNARDWQIYTVTPEGNGLAEIKNSYNKLPFHPAIFPLPAFQPDKSYTITESGDGLNLRQSPSLSAEVIKKLKEGEVIQVLEGPVEAEDYLWWRVRLEGSDDEGWVAEIPGWFKGEW